MKKFLGVLGNILVVILLVSALAVMTIVLTSQKGNGLPNLFGYSFLSVKSNSMDAAPANMKKGDMIIIEKRDDYNKLKVNDVITFFAFKDGQRYFDTHRIVKIEPHNGYNYYVTKGDNVVFEDLDRASFANVVGVWSGTKIPYLGGAMDFLKTQLGIMICVVIPLALLFIWQLYKFISVLGENKKQKALEEVAVNMEAEKQKAIEEYIAAQKAQEAAQATVTANAGKAVSAAAEKKEPVADNDAGRELSPADAAEEPAETPAEEEPAKEEPSGEEPAEPEQPASDTAGQVPPPADAKEEPAETPAEEEPSKEEASVSAEPAEPAEAETPVSEKEEQAAAPDKTIEPPAEETPAE